MIRDRSTSVWLALEASVSASNCSRWTRSKMISGAVRDTHIPKAGTMQLKRSAPFGALGFMETTAARTPLPEAHQTVRLNLETIGTTSSIRISFTDQRLTAHGGIIVWSHFLHQKRVRQRARQVLPHPPISPNAYDPIDVVRGYVGGILCGADKLSRVAWLQSDPAIAQVLGVEAVASQSTLVRFFNALSQGRCNVLAAFWSGGGVELCGRPTAAQTGSAKRSQSKLVTPNSEQADGFAQLHCSCLASSLKPKQTLP